MSEETARYLGRFIVTYELLEQLLSLPLGATIETTRETDQWRALVVTVEGHESLPLVAPGERIPQVRLEAKRVEVEARFVRDD